MKSKIRKNIPNVLNEIHQRAASLIRDCTNIRPAWALITGSGLSEPVDTMTERVVFPYESLPGFEPTAVEGHPGRLVFGRLGNTWLAVFQGRTHLYEDKGLDSVLSAARLARELRIRNIVITNAAGALRPPFVAGHLMPLTSHLNLAWLSGAGFTPAKARRRGIYDVEMTQQFTDIARRLGVPATPGVYAFLNGPTYETPAETRAYRILGAGAVGMSTVPEAIEAANLGMRVLAISCITNDAVPQSAEQEGPSHDKVLAVARTAAANLFRILEELMDEMKE
jgi:purine-nucleoside phosphorylase